MGHVFIPLEKAYWQKAIYSRGIRLNRRPAITKQRMHGNAYDCQTLFRDLSLSLRSVQYICVNKG